MYGNCLLCALVLMWRERRNNPKFIMKYRPGFYVPHFMIRTKDKLHHFNTVRDVLFWPFCYVLFEGKFRTVNISECDNLENN
jgi:hypothetical protein